MSEILDKISSYNIFNYLLPGILFAVMADTLTTYSLIQEDIFVGIFVYYFIGLVLSRVGSLVIEPILKKIKFVKFAPYDDYVKASKEDALIETLSETNNTLRTMCSLFVFMLGLLILDGIASSNPTVAESAPYVVAVLLLVLFLFSYRKQTKYIFDRVNIRK